MLAWRVTKDVQPGFVLAALEEAMAVRAERIGETSAPRRALIRCTRRLQGTDAAHLVGTAGDDELERTMHAHSKEYRAFLRRQRGVQYTRDGLLSPTWEWVDKHNREVAAR
ncbi:hypothetical protein [Streptomyces roseifaciens]|uniref:hypothetical protein n=1 Tax=Streptomyces roseifaciens TaxID=1488406 RepID=UPI0007180A2A|nr:hypothetical protein [Streptomyces roseifaciens]